MSERNLGSLTGEFVARLTSRYRARADERLWRRAANRGRSNRAWKWIVGEVFVILITLAGYLLVQTQQHLEKMQSELANEKQAADQAKAQAAELSKRVASLKAKFEKLSGNASDFAILKIGDMLMAQGDLAEALKWYRDSLAVAHRWVNAHPKNAGWQHNFSVSYSKVGDVLLAQGNLSEALKSYRDGLAVADRLAKSDPENIGWQHHVSISYNKIGDVLEAGGNLGEALKTYQESLAIRDRLAMADPNNPDRQRDLAISQNRVAIVLAKRGDGPRALDVFRQGRAIIARLAKQSPDNRQLCKDLAAFDDSIAKLEHASIPDTGSVKPVQVAPPDKRSPLAGL